MTNDCDCSCVLWERKKHEPLGGYSLYSDNRDDRRIF